MQKNNIRVWFGIIILCLMNIDGESSHHSSWCIMIYSQFMENRREYYQL